VFEHFSFQNTYHSSEVSMMASWIYYYDVMALHSFHHWQKSTPEKQHLRECQHINIRPLISQYDTSVSVYQVVSVYDRGTD
jgi:hypothetical protein